MMKRNLLKALLASTVLVCSLPAWAGQAPGAASDADIPLSHRDRVYAAEQFSNKVFRTDTFEQVATIPVGKLPHPSGDGSRVYVGLAKIGFAEDAPLHKGPWPIHNGRNYQPTEHELRASHQEDVTPGQAREIDRLYDHLLASSEKDRNRIAP